MGDADASDTSSSVHSTEAPSRRGPAALHCVEWFSGIGGLHYGLQRALELLNWRVQLSRVSLDINPVANEVLRHNFPDADLVAKGIEGLTSAHRVFRSPHRSPSPPLLLWLLSPPCQPFTRQGRQNDDQDRRSAALLQLISLLPEVQWKPDVLLLENVVGFESSNTRQRWASALESCGYCFQEFHISPVDIGVPNQRTRYFCLAWKTNVLASNLSTSSVPVILGARELQGSQIVSRPLLVSEYLAHTCSWCSGPDQGDCDYAVPEALLKKSGWCLDIAFADDHRTCCFTKAYGRYAEGTGSVIQTTDRSITASRDLESLRALRLRFFTPREIANLHCFPSTFEFPPHVTRSQKYRLLGNSLNVEVVARLLVHLLSAS